MDFYGGNEPQKTWNVPRGMLLLEQPVVTELVVRVYYRNLCTFLPRSQGVRGLAARYFATGCFAFPQKLIWSFVHRGLFIL